MPVKHNIGEREKEFLKTKYKLYYYNYLERIHIPAELEQREIGFLSFDGYFKRHMHFLSEKEFKTSILKEVPWGIFYSVAYYEDPSVTDMDKKGWLRADIVFDIDVKDLQPSCLREHDFLLCGDTIATANSYTKEVENNCIKIDWICNNCLAAAKDEAMRLTEVLIKELGIPPSKITVYYSGHRGFHVHVDEEELSELGKQARSQIVEYLTLTNLSKKTILRYLPVEEERRETLVGIPRRVLSNVEKTLGATLTLSRARILADQRRLDALLGNAVNAAKIRIDPQVTLDATRIFRLPGSLNEKSGLAKIKCDDVIACDPLEDAVAFDDEPVRINIRYAPKIKMLGYTFGPFKKEKIKVPLYLAVFLVSKGLASPA